MRLTLKEIREIRRVSIDDAANYCEVSVKDLYAFENDCTNMPISIADKMTKLYNISLDNIIIPA